MIVIDFIASAGNEENSINLRRGFHNLTLNYMSVDNIFSSQLYRSNILRTKQTTNSDLGAARVKTSVLFLYYEKLRNTCDSENHGCEEINLAVIKNSKG